MSKNVRFCVRGTTCHSCEVLLERELKKILGVLDVHASHAKGSVELVLTKDGDVTAQDLDRQVSGSAYRFSDWQESSAERSWNPYRLGGVALLVIALWYALDQFGLLSFSPSVSGSAGLATVFFIGLIASVSSCTAVLAGLIIALSATHAKQHGTESTRSRLRPHVLFNIGRLVGFAALGAVVGSVGSIVALSPAFNAAFVVGVALLMLALGANLLNLIPRGAFVIAPPKWLTHRIHALQDSSHPAVPFVLGVASFFLPCGFTQSVQLYALSTGDPLTASIIMTVFALGTIPALFGLGAATSFAHGRPLKRLTSVAGVLVLVIGFSQLLNGMTLLGVVTPGGASAHKLTVVQDAPMLVDGKQVIEMEIVGGSYAPDVLQVVVGIPVEWKIWGSEFMGCAQSLVSPGLGINTGLKPGDNTVVFTPSKPGRYAFSCSMGMVRGTMIVTGG